MTKLLIIADDLTGALDTGVQFAQLGISVQMCSDPAHVPQNTSDDVLVINAHTRHMHPREAYRVVYDIIAGFGGRIKYVYKKTDSALRGCVGAELDAAAKALNTSVAFVPALPKLGRTTVNATQYINGTELAKSEFGMDPLEPMHNSYIPDIISEQSDIPCRIGGRISNSPEICIFDASTDEDVMRTAAELVNGGAVLFAGCAGLAGALARLLPFEKGQAMQPVKTASFGVICGSLNPTTAAQVEYASEREFRVVAIDAGEFLRADFQKSEQRVYASIRMKDITSVKLPFVLKAGGPAITGSNAGQLIADGLGCMAKEMLSVMDGYTLLVTGGDTLMAFIKYCGYPTLRIARELSSGVVCLLAEIQGKTVQLVSKSGGFGRPELFDQLYKMMKD
ncbi:MAG: four-carbon acid sugar kinase family protein [Clostridia bacterium]|nr:four-carbon acid sugar kinase family protein [Clostridia bacterium]